MKILFLLLSVCILCTTLSYSQNSLVHNRLRMITQGKGDDVRKEMPELLKDYPDDPGVMFLNGVLMDDGSKATTIYEQITREYPQSEWADDAQWRIVQFYCLKRDTNRAQRELANFKRNYPLSEFLIHAMDIVKATVGNNIASTKTSAVATPVKAEKETPPAKAKDAEKATPLKTVKENILVESKPAEKVASKTTETKAIEKPVEKAIPVDEPTTTKHWGLQVGLYASKKTADAEAQKYKDQRMKVDVISKDGKFSVVVGNYTTKESAEGSKEIIKAQCQCTPYVVEK